MNNKQAAGASIGIEPYRRFARTQSYVAIPFSSDIVTRGIDDEDYGHSLSFALRESIDSIAYDILIRGEAVRLFTLRRTKSGHLLFSIIDENKADMSSEFDLVYSKKKTFKCENFGIKKKQINNLVQKLSNSKLPPIDSEFVRRSNISYEIADRAGRAIPWGISQSSSFTDPCILLDRCNQKILAIQICKGIEDRVNAFLREAGADAEITIPCFSVDELVESKEQFIKGSIGVEEFSDVVFSH